MRSVARQHRVLNRCGVRCFGTSIVGDSDVQRVARIAVVGCGWWTQGWHLPHLERNPGAVIAGLCDPSPSLTSSLNPDMLQLPELQTKYNAPAFSSLQDLLDAGIEVDGVLIGSNHASHYDISKVALEAGLHVFCEKPMTTNVDEARSLVQLVDAATDSVFMVNNTANWRENTMKATKLIEAGRIGTVRKRMVMLVKLPVVKI